MRCQCTLYGRDRRHFYYWGRVMGLKGNDPITGGLSCAHLAEIEKQSDNILRIKINKQKY